MYLTLDLSLKCSGWTKFSDNGSLLDKGRIIPDEDIDNSFKIHYITEKVKELFDNVENLVIEDLFYGKNFKTIRELARLSGAIIYSWIVEKYKIPYFYMASTARKLSGINGRAHKAEVQVWVLEKYEFANKKKIKKYKNKIKKLERKYESEEHTKGQYQYRLNKLSNKIDEETGIGQDIADSIVLGIAFKNENKG